MKTMAAKRSREELLGLVIPPETLEQLKTEVDEVIAKRNIEAIAAMIAANIRDAGRGRIDTVLSGRLAEILKEIAELRGMVMIRMYPEQTKEALRLELEREEADQDEESQT